MKKFGLKLKALKDYTTPLRRYLYKTIKQNRGIREKEDNHTLHSPLHPTKHKMTHSE